MNKIGIVSTSYISEVLYQASFDVEVEHSFTALFSRDYDRGVEFASKFGSLDVYDDYSEFLKSDVDIVYVCSCNFKHVDYAKLAIMAKKHVLIEKPMVLDVSDVSLLYDLARENGVFIMEALTTMSNPLYLELKKFLKDEVIVDMSLSMAKRSRFYEPYLLGEDFNVFDKKLGGGALNDLGIYLLYPVVDLCGLPNSYFAGFVNARMGADLSMSALLCYESFNVDLKCGKNFDYENLNLITTENNLIKVDSWGQLSCLEIFDLEGNLVKKITTSESNMSFELEHFLNCLKTLSSLIYTEKLAIDVHFLRSELQKYNQE